MQNISRMLIYGFLSLSLWNATIAVGQLLGHCFTAKLLVAQVHANGQLQCQSLWIVYLSHNIRWLICLWKSFISGNHLFVNKAQRSAYRAELCVAVQSNYVMCFSVHYWGVLLRAQTIKKCFAPSVDCWIMYIHLQSVHPTPLIDSLPATLVKHTVGEVNFG